MSIVYIAIGSNLGDSIATAKLAIEALRALPHSQFIGCSSLYSSSPMGPQEQPDYVNAVAKIDTQLLPLELLDLTQKIELEQGRVRKDERWGPRTLDLDLLLFGDQVINTERLTIPHYGMKTREFVLYPLMEIEPQLQLPDGTAIASLITHIDKNGLEILANA
ncbi:2-amino-4-hydroxy-6-hydroxymethyldihydropteridine diphosphokinase [Vibrio ulleungensis]|uniref:2-amino-4-hydroxy-6-hydroxymethyldihydropteridine pyrophosphokinase n=1 Tax=Vibrio ulleungensis TaxID=2807619 RepID=A0ABS2HPQ3_9VIBR|nr:2-amino-4-hydroxy-6-hydroxymethyldihydropteridine diphosphokinase [Vibrio ulleungensis]MBM7037846.1 2-amino-4-hydroxy-6-hydroxymethyldihydropteridine diphosphokinase [Vibrio ulleungensis]